MPNRILRDWTDSESINAISPQAEVFFVRLVMKVDDFGRFQANPRLLSSLLFPLKSSVRDTDSTRWLAECEKSGLLAVYEVKGRSYLEIQNFRQRSRASESKFPSPDGHVTDTRQSPAHVDEDVFVDGGGDDKGRGKPLPLVFPSPLETEEFREAWGQYLAYRRQRSLPSLKPMSVSAQLTEMASWGLPEALQAIRSSIANGWNGIFKPKAPGSIHSSKTKPNIANSKYSHDF